MSKPHIKFDHSKPLFSGILSFTILLSMLWVLFSFKEFPCKPNDPLHPLDCLNLSWADFNTTIAVIEAYSWRCFGFPQLTLYPEGDVRAACPI